MKKSKFTGEQITFEATTYVKYKSGDKHNSIVSVRFRLDEILSTLNI